jgi:nitroreductase
LGDTPTLWQPDPLPKGCVEKIIEVARWEPSGFYTQPWEFVVVKKKEVKEAIIKAFDNYAPPITKPESAKELLGAPRPSFRDAPAYIILLADWRAKAGWPGHSTEINPMVHSRIAR